MEMVYKKRGYRRKSYNYRPPGAVDAFGMLEALLGLFLIPAVAIFDRKTVYDKYRGNGGELSKTQFSQVLNRLARSGYVILHHGQGQHAIEFTRKGEIKVIEKKLHQLEHDNKYRFISFDIPEEKRRQRDQFRRAIKRVGFKQIQKSLWVINKDVSYYIELAAREYGVEKYITYIVAELSDIDNLLEKMFDSRE